MESDDRKLITLKDIAETAGVSVATVSNAISGKGRISEATRQRIIALAEEMNYTPNKSAQSLVMRRTSIIGKGKEDGARKRRAPRRERGEMHYQDIEALTAFVETEIAQRREEGCDVTEIEARFEQAVVRRPSKKELESIFSALQHLVVGSDFPYREPLKLEEIRGERPDGPRQISLRISADVLFDKIYGAWLGRCAGCLLGKPLETGWPREKIARYLKMANAYPLTNYVPEIIPHPEGYELHPDASQSVLGRIDGMPHDDDIDYTIIGLHVLEEYGPDFTTEDVATEWLNHLPYFSTWTAERIAYRNLTNDIQPPYTATYRNPYREMIGAQIRADIWGYTTPGKPELGAEFAFRDACLSHVKNGIYGEMWVAAMLSAAFITDDVEKIIEIGLSEIPRASRLAEAIHRVVNWYRKGNDWETTVDRIWETYGHYNMVHVINNAAVVAMALLYGQSDLERSISLAVMSGFDTDCNGATVGSVVGMIRGARALPAKWIDPLDDRLESFVVGFTHSRISELACRTAAISRKILEQNR
ncbi:MAG: ADP-ribosylglycohydrolase family protein [Candidatus Hadarchaeum sp.]